MHQILVLIINNYTSEISKLIVSIEKYMVKYIWQAAKALLCESLELLHNTGLTQTKGPVCESDGVEQLLYNTGLTQTKQPLCKPWQVY